MEGDTQYKEGGYVIQRKGQIQCKWEGGPILEQSPFQS